MAKRYIEIDPEKFENFLRACGFTRTVQGSEVVYRRTNHHLDAVVVKVYTTIRAKAGEARGRGEDAIRVTCAYESDVPFRGRTSFGIFKATRTFRTGTQEGVFDRTYQRMREAFSEGNSWLRKNWPELQKAHKAAEEAERRHR